MVSVQSKLTYHVNVMVHDDVVILHIMQCLSFTIWYDCTGFVRAESLCFFILIFVVVKYCMLLLTNAGSCLPLQAHLKANCFLSECVLLQSPAGELLIAGFL